MTRSPKYMQIVNWAKEKMEDGSFAPGEKFLSETALSSRFGLSRQTVRHALGILEREGYVHRVQGSGTYVRQDIVPERPRSMNIGIISTYLDDYIFPGIIRGIESVLTANGYAMQFAFTRNKIANESRALQSMLEKNLDGLIVEPTKSGLPCFNLELYRSIQKKKIPLVFFNAWYPALSAPRVALDDEKAGYAATRHLIDMGHESIFGIFLHNDLQGHLRYLGFIKALSDAGLPIEDENVLWYSTEESNGRFRESYLLERLQGRTGVLCYNDQLAIRLMEMLRSQGMRVPEDMSVVGIDNSDMSDVGATSLTTVAHPLEELGKSAAELLLEIIGGGEERNILFPPKLILRGSVKNRIPGAELL